MVTYGSLVPQIWLKWQNKLVLHKQTSKEAMTRQDLAEDALQTKTSLKVMR